MKRLGMIWVLIPVLIAAPASAVRLQIDWEGTATRVGYVESGGAWVEMPSSAAVRGRVILDLAELDASLWTGTSFAWNSLGGPDYSEWSFEIDDATLPPMHTYDGNCFTFCSMTPENGFDRDALFLHGDDDPLGGFLVLDDPTGRLIGDDLGIRPASGLTGSWAMATILREDITRDGFLEGMVDRAEVSLVPEPTGALAFGVGALVIRAAVRRRKP